MISKRSQSASEKNKTASIRPDAPSCLSCLFLLVLVSSDRSVSFLHDNECLPCREKGIICGTGSKKPHYRMHDYHDSGARLSFPRRSLFGSLFPSRLSPWPFLFLREDPSSSSVAPRNRWNGKSTTRPGQRSRNWSGTELLQPPRWLHQRNPTRFTGVTRVR